MEDIFSSLSRPKRYWCRLCFSNKCTGPFRGKCKEGGLNGMIPSFPAATEFPGAACGLPICASCRLAELKCSRDEGNGSLIPSGHRNSLCGLSFSSNFSVILGEGSVGGINDKLHSLQTATVIPCLNFAKPTRTFGPIRGSEV
jgi:hypothetical protein